MNRIDPAPGAYPAASTRRKGWRILPILLTAALLSACDTGQPAPTVTTSPTEATTATVAPAPPPSPTIPAATATPLILPSPTLPPPSPTVALAAPTSTVPPLAPAATVTAPSQAGTPEAPAASVANAIKAVITRGNQEEQQAVAAQDPSLMRDTSATSYYTQMTQDVTDLINSGVTAIKLLDLTWGAISLQGAGSAQATTSETWLTTFADGSTLQETDANVYTLALQGGTWRVQADDHPNDRRLKPTPGTTGTPGTVPTAPATTPAPVTDQSNNWAGYTATGGTYTVVSGTWTIPTINATNATNGLGADATWVGIGGVTGTDLIQAGTDAQVQGGQTTYTAWWETLPQVAQPVPMTVDAGDTMHVSVAQQADGKWQIVITDSTRQETFQTRLAYASSRSSAEWIEESPTAGRRLLLPLDNFGTVNFTQATTVENGRTRTIAQARGKPITLYVPGGAALAVPSALAADGTSFTVTRTDVPAPRISPSGGGGRRRGP